MCVAILLNEMCNMQPDGEKCSSPNINFLKAVTTLTTIATLFFMLWQWTVIRRRDATKASLSTRHVKYKPKGGESQPKEIFAVNSIWGWLSTSLYSTFWKYLPFILNFSLNCIHTVPGLSFSVSAEMLGMNVEYHIESLLTVITL